MQIDSFAGESEIRSAADCWPRKPEFGGGADRARKPYRK